MEPTFWGEFLNLKKATGFLKKIKGTLFLGILMIAIFFLISDTGFFIQEETADIYSVSLFSPFNVLPHMLVHISAEHLFSNVLALLLFGAILELVVGSNALFVIFVGAAAFSSVIFLVLAPYSALIGASSGISGIIASAFVVRIRGAFIVMVVMLVLISSFIFVSSSQIMETEKDLSAQKKAANEDIIEAIKSGDVYRQESMQMEIKKIEKKQEQISEGKKFVSRTMNSPIPHILGGMIGIFFLFYLKTDEFKNGMKKGMRTIGSFIGKKP